MTGNTTKVRSLLLTALMVMSVFAGATAFAGSAVAANYEDSGANDRLTSGETFWGGQVLWFQATGDTGDDNVVELYKNVSDGSDDFVTRIALDSEGNSTFDTSGLQSDYYLKYLGSGGTKITFGDSGKSVSGTATDFTIRDQNFDASFESGSVANDANASVDFDTNRGRVNVTVTSDDFEKAGLEDIFETNQVHNTSYSVTVQVLDSNAYEANFTGISTGDYDFTFTVNDFNGLSVSDNITVTDAADSVSSFEDSVTSVSRGDIAAITVNLQNAQTAEVEIATKSSDYFQINATVTDGNEDGQVTLYLNTFRTGEDVKSDDSSVVYASEGDSVKLDDDNEAISGPLGQGDYELRTWVGSEENREIAALSVNPRSTGSSQTWVKPTKSGTEDSLANLTDSLTQRSNVAKGDKVVVQVKDTPGIFGALYNGEDVLLDTENGQGDAGNLTMTVTESGDNVESNTDAESINASNFSIVKDGANNTFYAVIPVSTLEKTDTQGDATGEWTATFTISEEYALAGEEDESVSSTFSVEDASIELNGGDDVTVPQSEHSISGETNLAPGTELTVIASSPGVFYKNTDITVSDDGTFEASFDFSDYDNATEFNVEVTGYDTAAVGGVVNVNAQDDTTTTTTTTTTTSSEPSTTTSTTPGDETTTTTTSSDGQPGFGVAISVVALLAAALLALRREN